MAKRYRYRYTVSGRSNSWGFPIDMFRYDQAYPASEADAATIERINRYRRTDNRDPFTVVVEGESEPTAARWASFGWHVGTVEKIAVPS